MKKDLKQELTKPSHTIYQLTVQGNLTEDSQDWFNGILIAAEHNTKNNQTTMLTCRVRDQAELLGIINWLHNMNLIIEKVCLASTGLEEADVKKVDMRAERLDTGKGFQLLRKDLFVY